MNRRSFAARIGAVAASIALVPMKLVARRSVLTDEHSANDGGWPRYAVESCQPLCPLCGDMFESPERSAWWDLKPRKVVCPGWREVAEPVEARSLVLMCTCEDWLTCAHPWPEIVEAPPLPVRMVPCGWNGEVVFSRRQSGIA